MCHLCIKIFNTKTIFYIRLLLLLLSRFSCVQLCATPETAAHQAPPPWDSPGKNTGVGCHFLLQCMKVKSESEVAQSCPTLSDPVDCSLPGSSVHGIFQARVLEWGAIAFSILYTIYIQMHIYIIFKWNTGICNNLVREIVVVQSLSRVQLCDPRDCSTPGFPVLLHVQEFAQTHYH